MVTNTLTNPKVSIWKLLLLILAESIIGLFIAEEIVLFLAILVGLVLFILLIGKPELSLAIVFNGTLVYFYSFYKLGYEPNRVTTGGFYGFLAVAYILGGVLFVAKKPHILKLGLIDLSFIFFFFLVSLSYLVFSLNNENASRKIAYAPLLVIAPYFGTRLMLSERRIKNFFKYCVFVAGALIIPAFYELLFNPFLVHKFRFSMYLFEGGKDNPILFGITFAILLIILSVWALEQRILKLKYLILMILSIFLLLRSGSRGAVISFLVTLSFYLLIIGRLRFKTKVYAAVLIIFLILVACIIIPEPLIKFYQYTFTSEARLTNVSSIYQRIMFWKQTFTEFVENPILGVGLGNSVKGVGFPHNIILEAAAELGIGGVFIFLSMCYLTIKKAFRFIKKEETQNLKLMMKIALLLFIYSLVEAMFSGHIANQTRLFMSMGLIESCNNLGLGLKQK
jgi:O-antigen ligase